MSLVTSIVRGFYKSPSHPAKVIEPRDIIKIVAKAYGVTEDDTKIKYSGNRNIILARQVAMYVISIERKDLPLKKIGKLFWESLHHTTVSWAIIHIQNLIETECDDVINRLPIINLQIKNYLNGTYS